ncbi:MAG: autotransporter outer membrane beta-barrel domain-containing protein [Enterobacteriaceae bacterium]|jgi:outer membrane lipase/esterase|nr:autotransporter outer membrane beta-barrel domain-containing protein [Enterobacteriaceae bacterium]
MKKTLFGLSAIAVCLSAYITSAQGSAASPYESPAYIMALPHINRLPVKGVRAYLDDHLQQLHNNDHVQGNTGIFGGYTHNGHHIFTLGSDYQLTDKLLLGAAYSHFRGERDLFSSALSYSASAHTFVTYALWNIYDNAWLSGDLHYSRVSFDSTTRRFEFFGNDSKETGSTSGQHWGLHVTVGWDIPITSAISTSPIIQYSWDKSHINGYREPNYSPTSVSFSDQNYKSQVGTLGWRVDTHLGHFNPYASVQIHHQFGDNHANLRITSDYLGQSFDVNSGKLDTDWRQYTLGVTAKFPSKKWQGFASISRNEGSAQEPDYNVNLGLSTTF